MTTMRAKRANNSSSGSARGGRKSPFTETQRAWIVEKAMDFGCVPPAAGLNGILEEGLAAGKLPEQTTREQVRSVCQTHFK